MICRKLIAERWLIGAVVATMLAAVIVSGCAVDNGPEDGRDSDRATVSQGISERESGDSGGEHGRRGEREESGEGSGEHGSGGEGGSGGESSEAAMSSPVIPLGQSWDGVLGGLAVSMQYDAATRTVHGTVRNTLSQKLCYVQAEPHLKSGTKTVGELGPISWGTWTPDRKQRQTCRSPANRNLQGFPTTDT